MTPLPQSPRELLTDPAALAAVMGRLRALRRLRLDLTVDGTLTSCALRLSPANAILSGTLTLPTAEPPAVELDPETITWRDAILAAGGTVSAASITLADELIKAIKAESFSSKLVYLLPLLGSDLTAARMPLRDSLAAGMAINTGFTNADFSESTGLKGNGTSKILNLNLKPAQLGASNNGGLGYWENNIDFGGTGPEPIGCYEISGTSGRFVLDLRSSLRAFRWGTFPAWASQAVAAVNGHYYGQRASGTSQELFLNGTSVASNSTANSVVGSNDLHIRLMGVISTSGATQIPTYWKGRCAVAYLTDGTLTSAEVAAFHTLLGTYLITPTGR